MKILFLGHNEIDKQKWDEVIASSHNSLPYAFSWYLDCVCPGWNALVSDDYKYVFPLTENRKLGIRYLFQPYFTQQLGLFSADEISSEKILAFLNAIPETYKLIEINLNYRNSLEKPGWAISKWRNFELNLSRPYAEIAKNYSQNQKRNIAKAKKNDLAVTEKITTEEIIKLFKTDIGAELESMKTKHYLMLKKLVSTLQAKQSCFLRGVADGEKNNCGALFVKTPNRIIFLFSGNSTEGKNFGAMSLLIDSVIEEFAGKPLIFDFEGSNNPGLARYYKSFGSNELVYLHLKKNTLSYPLRLLKK